MAKKFFIYSTLTSSVIYAAFAVMSNDELAPKEGILVAGGANLSDKRGDTPSGVVTELTEQQFELVKQDPVFQLHVKNGYIVVGEGDTKEDADKVALDMERSDKSAPDTESDFDKDGDGGGMKVSTGPAKKK